MGNMWIDAQEAVSDNRLPIISDYVTMTYADGATDTTGTRRLICTIPAYSVVTRVFVRILTNFNAATNDYLTVGSLTDDDLLVNDLDVSTAATPLLTEVASTTLPYYTAVELKVWATYIYSSTAPTTGELEVALEWIPWTKRGDEVTT